MFTKNNSRNNYFFIFISLKPEHVESMMEKLDDGVKDEQKEKEEAAKVLNILRRISSFTYNCSYKNARLLYVWFLK